MRPRPLFRSKRRVTLSKSEPRILHRLPQTRAGRRAGPRHLRTLGAQAPRSRNRRGAPSDAQFVPHAPHYAPRTRVTPFCIFARRPAGALVPLTNHGIPAMSMGFLLPGADAPVAWRGLMVQKAVQQLLFDVDWRGADPHGPGLDILVIDMPPGTGDVPLSLGQLVNVDGTSVYVLFFFLLLFYVLRLGWAGAVIVSTPQDVALADVRKGIAAFHKLSIPVRPFVFRGPLGIDLSSF